MSQGKRILVMDDERDVLLIIKRSLERWGYMVDTFTDATKALDHLKSNPDAYNLIISDIRMPLMNGFEFIAAIKQFVPSTKVFLMTAFDISNDDVKMALPHLKIDDFLRKPVALTVICKTVEKHLVPPQS